MFSIPRLILEIAFSGYISKHKQPLQLLGKDLCSSCVFLAYSHGAAICRHWACFSAVCDLATMLAPRLLIVNNVFCALSIMAIIFLHCFCLVSILSERFVYLVYLALFGTWCKCLALCPIGANLLVRPLMFNNSYCFDMKGHCYLCGHFMVVVLKMFGL